MLRVRLLVASFAFVALSCGESTAPAPLDGTYALVAENDQPLPFGITFENSEQGPTSGGAIR